MLIAPTEPGIIKALGTSSTMPEKYGADVLHLPGRGIVGIQRKEVSDLVSSMRDGRFAKELAQMAALHRGLLLIEGAWYWAGDGQSAAVRGFTRDQYHGLCLSVQAQGFWIIETTDLGDTVRFLERFPAWASRQNHDSLLARPKATSRWGSPDSAEWGVHFWQSFDGISIKRAKALYAKLGLPLAWTCTEDDLLGVEGIGKVTAKKLWEALNTGGKFWDRT
jgi:ERCC4-type nuclease